jgi:hypothetical protein
MFSLQDDVQLSVFLVEDGQFVQQEIRLYKRYSGAVKPGLLFGLARPRSSFLTFHWPSSHIETMKDPNDSFNSTVLLLRNIGETHEWEITVMGQGEKPMSRFTFRGSRREADDMAIRGRLSAEIKLEATARNVKARPSDQRRL